MSIFRHLKPEELEVINKNRINVHFMAGENICKQGTALTHVACLTRGSAKICIEGYNSKKLLLKVVKPTGMVAGPGMFNDFRHHYSVIALEESAACFIEAGAFTDVALSNKEFNKELLRWINLQQSYLFDRMVNLTQKQMPGRIADVLIYLFEEIHASESFDTHLSRQDIADMAAMSKESAIRILKEFKDAGIIEVEGNHFHIIKTESLKVIQQNG